MKSWTMDMCMRAGIIIKSSGQWEVNSYQCGRMLGIG